MIRWTLETYETLPSTQDRVRQKSQQAAEGFAVQALSQSGGYGRHGREWISQEGNLYISLLLHPLCDVGKGGQIALLTGVALARTIESFIRRDAIRLKWPNDVLLENKKCAGILLETVLGKDALIDRAIIGIGVNVASSPSPEFSCLQDYTATPLSVEGVRDRLLAEIAALYQEWQLTGFASICKAWLIYGPEKGAMVQVKNGPLVEKGSFYDIDEAGSMILKTDHDIFKTIHAGDVTLQE